MAGLANAGQCAIIGYRDGIGWALAGLVLGFLLPIPLVAVIVGGKVFLDRYFPRKQPIETNVLGAILVGVGICALIILPGIIWRHLR